VDLTLTRFAFLLVIAVLEREELDSAGKGPN
jgi:chromosome condensin MukBEF complex kleisin-like MukF subunit